MIHNYQPHKIIQRQKSSSLLQVKNNLLNQIQPIQQHIPQSQQVPIIEIDLKNIQPVMVTVKSSPKIIRIQKKLFKRSTSQKKMQQTNLASDNFNRNLLTNNINYNKQINILSKNSIKSPENFYSNNYEVTSPINNNNFFLLIILFHIKTIIIHLLKLRINSNNQQKILIIILNIKDIKFKIFPI